MGIASKRHKHDKVKARWDYYGGKCWMCKRPADTIDHVKPLAAGGKWLAANIRPSCFTCNQFKGNLWPLSKRVLKMIQLNIIRRRNSHAEQRRLVAAYLHRVGLKGTCQECDNSVLLKVAAIPTRYDGIHNTQIVTHKHACPGEEKEPVTPWSMGQIKNLTTQQRIHIIREACGAFRDELAVAS